MTAINGGSCDTCGELNVAGTQFCTSCGSYLGWNAPVAPSSDEQTLPPRGFRPPPPPPGGGDLTQRFARTAPAPPPVRAATGTLPPPGPAMAPGPTATGQVCPSCSTDNPPTRRFCRRCGYVLQSPVARPKAVVAREPWWRRWFRRRPSAERAARAAFRHSLSWRTRFFRVVCVLVAILAALGLLRFVGRDPLAWAKHRIDDLRGTLVQVDDVTAAVDPPKAADPKFPPTAAVDGRTDTAWGARWTDPTGGVTAGGGCDGSPTAGTALLLTAPTETTVRGIRVRAGLPVADANRPLQWRPHVLELRFSDGRCQRVELQDSPDPQIVQITAVDANAVRVSVVGAYAPATPPQTGQVAITEIDLLSRPK